MKESYGSVNYIIIIGKLIVVEITSQTDQLGWVVKVNHVISMLSAGASPAPLFILDRIYTLLHTGCPPGAMFSRCAPCLFNKIDIYTIFKTISIGPLK